MDQKNTIVKCAMHKCLFNYSGTCDQYIITIGVNGKCTAYCKANQQSADNQMCWYCDHGKHGKCKFFIKPMKNSNGECCRFTSTGGNR